MVFLIGGWLLHHVLSFRVLHSILKHVKTELKATELETHSDSRDIKFEVDFRSLQALLFASDPSS